jgi:replication-associated recombination protein RarA
LALRSQGPSHIILSGPPSSAKTVFLMSLRQHLKDSYFVDSGNTTKAGIINYLFKNRAAYLLIDEIDKMSPRDQTFLLNLMETGIVTETKHRKIMEAEIKTSVFATCNDPRKLSAPLRSRFFIVELEPYTYEQF